MTATEFKARCLALIDQVRERGEPIVITKRGRVIAALEPAGEFDDRPWLPVRGTARWRGDPTAPAIREGDIQAVCVTSTIRYGGGDRARKLTRVENA